MLAYKVVTLHRYSINSVIGLELYYEKGRTVQAPEGTPGIFVFKHYEDAWQFVNKHGKYYYMILDVRTKGQCRRCFKKFDVYMLRNIRAWWKYHMDKKATEPLKTRATPKGTFVCPAVTVLP